MDKVTRVKNAVQGKAVDKIPFSFWTHLPEVDTQPKVVARQTYDLYQKYDLDYIKMMNNGMYSAQAFGGDFDSSEVATGGTTFLRDTPIKEAEDLAKVNMENFDQSVYDRELTHLKELLKLVDGEAPVIFTIFSPLTTLDKLSLNRADEFISEGHGDLMKQALEVITESTIELSKQVIELGAAGIYFASQLSSYDRTTEERYAEYGVPYDVRVLEAVKKDGWLNTIHVHGENTMFDLMKDYPVPVYNWHSWDTEPSIEVGQEKTGKAIMGGIAPKVINEANLEELTHQVSEDIKRLNGKNLLLGSNCVIPLPFESSTINHIQKVITDAFEEIK